MCNASKSYGWDVRNIAKISPKMVKKGPFFDFRKKPKPTPLPHMRLWLNIGTIYWVSEKTWNLSRQTKNVSKYSFIHSTILRQCSQILQELIFLKLENMKKLFQKESEVTNYFLGPKVKTQMSRSRSYYFYFLPPQIYLWMGEENHNLCCVFIPILPNLHDLHPLAPNWVTLAQLVVRLPGRHEVVGSKPCWCVTFLAESIPVLSGRLVSDIHCLEDHCDICGKWMASRKGCMIDHYLLCHNGKNKDVAACPLVCREHFNFFNVSHQ